jgi:hypothetical protein
MEITKRDLKALSASRIKTLESCSWLYWCNYHLKLPQIQNDGARKGDICHRIFELLLNKKHNKIFKKIIKAGTITVSKAIERLIRIYSKEIELNLTAEVFLQIDQMILVGLKNDFFVKDAILVQPEYKFDLKNESPFYYIKGFMDKPFMTKELLIIDDFKSSKRKFDGEDQESNVQAMIYSLAATKIWPDKKPKIRFIFLQYPEDPMMELEFSEDTLRGFEFYLEEVQNRVNNFNERQGRAAFAYDKGQPKGGEFKGKLMCGFAKSPDQKKKDGTKMWHCPYKFAFDYWIVKKDGIIKYTSFSDDKIKLKEGETKEKAHYSGCPRFNGDSNVLNNFEKTPVSKVAEPLEYRNVLNDF